MIGQDPSTDAEDEPLKNWRQGDFALGVGGFLYAGPTNGDELFDAEETNTDILGLIAISQTCDIIRRTGGRHFVSVCPLVSRPDDEVKAIKKGYRPYYAKVEHADENVFADLRRIMSVSKDLLRTWDRQQGFSSEEQQSLFAMALERKFGQFAFPNEFDDAMAEFQKRVWSRHDKANSDVGKAYRSLIQIRFRADPNWSAESKKITVIAVLHESDHRQIERSEIKTELGESFAKISWPQGYEWADIKFILATAKELSADDLLSSQRADFDFLCI